MPNTTASATSTARQKSCVNKQSDFIHSAANAKANQLLAGILRQSQVTGNAACARSGRATQGSPLQGFIRCLSHAAHVYSATDTPRPVTALASRRQYTISRIARCCVGGQCLRDLRPALAGEWAGHEGADARSALSQRLLPIFDSARRQACKIHRTHRRCIDANKLWSKAHEKTDFLCPCPAIAACQPRTASDYALGHVSAITAANGARPWSAAWITSG